jgi:hypothetical protein
MTCRAGGGRLRGDHASATTETVLVMPALIGFLFLLVLAGRLTDARSDLVGAANDAARAASLQYDFASAEVQAQAAADDSVAGEKLDCAGGPQVTLDPGEPFVRGGVVHVHVVCVVATSDLAYLNLGPRVTLEEDAWEPIDTYRSS